MKSDVPSLEACKRLAEAGLIPPAESGNIWWWVELPPDSPFLTRCPVSERLDLGVYTYAPTLGEMLAEIRRRGWGAEIRDDLRDEGRVPVFIWTMRVEAGLQSSGDLQSGIDVAGQHVSESIADALALALAEAMEKESKNKGT